ncbi:hypothetical protein Godav_004015 [Gossypium davidsonii]|uniref:Uncharacterized protein n=2 Tax=Gossypium TaxID=3633 RepID=A0A7J8SKJ1_GOSDV|nr:hypothetical protein [Gossypium davidsonii]MBA0661940.1 hypothetical protein [Gossypium klotzschianum]
MTIRVGGGGGEGEESKSPETELSGEFSGNLSVLLAESDDESEFSNEGSVEKEKLEEIMQELYKEITVTSSSLPFFGKSCGASMSDSSSSVMAGIELVAPTKELLVIGMGFNDNKSVMVDEVKEMDGCDDDQWLARALGWVSMELEESHQWNLAFSETPWTVGMWCPWEG